MAEIEEGGSEADCRSFVYEIDVEEHEESS